MGVNKMINTHASDLRDEVIKIIETDGPGGSIEDYLAECIEQTVLCIGLLGSPSAVKMLPSISSTPHRNSCSKFNPHSSHDYKTSRPSQPTD